jgi:PAS domain S-box-containing protein
VRRWSLRALLVAAIRRLQTTIARDPTAARPIERDPCGELCFRQLLESAPDAMVLTDDAGRIVLVNAQAEKTFGYSRADLLGQPVEMLIPEHVRERHQGHRSGDLDQPTARPMGRGRDPWGRRRDGSEFPVDIRLSPVETETGLLVCSTIRDVTEQQALRAELERTTGELQEEYQRLQAATRRQSELLANMSHELRTPLNGIIGFAELMHDGKVGPVAPDHREYLGDILTSGRHLLHLIDDLRDLARAEPGTAPTILVVDDDPASLELADRALLQLGYRVICRPSTETALRAVDEHGPAAIVVDLVAPDGFELLRRVRGMPRAAGTPVVVWTGKELNQYEREALATLANAVVPKSDGATALLQALQRRLPPVHAAVTTRRGR